MKPNGSAVTFQRLKAMHTKNFRLYENEAHWEQIACPPLLFGCWPSLRPRILHP